MSFGDLFSVISIMDNRKEILETQMKELDNIKSVLLTQGGPMAIYYITNRLDMIRETIMNLGKTSKIENRTKQKHVKFDLIKEILKSHKVLCKIKNMGEKEAYSHPDPILYYAAGCAGETGEMLNKLVKSVRNGSDKKASIEAVTSELPDVFIYGIILAFICDIDIFKLTLEKSKEVMKRAKRGYYGGPMHHTKKSESKKSK